MQIKINEIEKIIKKNRENKRKKKKRIPSQFALRTLVHHAQKSKLKVARYGFTTARSLGTKMTNARARYNPKENKQTWPPAGQVIFQVKFLAFPSVNFLKTLQT